MENNQAVETVWVEASNGDAPPGTLVGGHDSKGEPIYVARAPSGEDLAPGKLIASHGCTYVTSNGKELKRTLYETVWVEASNGDAPPGTLVGGHNSKGEPIYVARAPSGEDLAPGKLIASHGCTYVTCNGKELKRTLYEVLVGSTNIWVPASGSKIPTKSYAGGYVRDGEPLYIGRVYHKDSITTGKVQQSTGLCYIAFDGQELSFSDYEVLTY